MYQARGPKKHLKRLNAPNHWMMDKLGGIWAPRSSAGPHALQDSLPVILILRQRLKYALTAKEALSICMRRLIKVDGKVRTDPRFPTGLMDVVSIEKTKEDFRLLYDTKGRFTLTPIDKAEAKWKLCKVTAVRVGPKKVPMITTHDGRTIRYPDPLIKVNDTIKLDLETNKILEIYKYEIGQLVLIVRGKNAGRVGVLQSREVHQGSFDIIYVKDSRGNLFATRLSASFVIGNENQSAIKLPKGKGIKLSIIEEKAAKAKKAAHVARMRK
ncbi:40S ribosomal protein S4 [Hondaea fermentalgiana]|uniref:40S ribosomal protein S4 n=1 Tax=Hondaea fermentalgiana TaxID=2315210 RepID=A0A2R5G1H7_9STRA|nr:40S ribosomal protein S4 [Hondaea fermentalgiana]|eukprot:GBG24877.1 40S ribosomal protein S4 [Hondaea fermentalgiana]